MLAPVPALPTTVVPGSIVKVAPFLTATKPLRTHTLSAVKVVSVVISPDKFTFGVSPNAIAKLARVSSPEDATAEATKDLVITVVLSMSTKF